MKNKKYTVEIISRQTIINKHQLRREEDFQIYLNYFNKIFNDRLLERGYISNLKIIRKNFNKESFSGLKNDYSWEETIQAIRFLLNEYKKEKYRIQFLEEFEEQKSIGLTIWINP